MPTIPVVEHFHSYVQNFEGTPAGQTLAASGCTSAPSTTQAHGGARSLAITPLGVSNDSFVAIGGDFATLNNSGLTLTPARAYRFTGWRFVPVGVTVINSQAPAKVYLDNGAGQPLRAGSGRWVSGSEPAAGTWGQYEIVFYTTPLTAATQRISLRIYNGASTVSSVVYWDDLSLKEYVVESSKFYLWYVANDHVNTTYGGTNDWHTIDFGTSVNAEPSTGSALTTVSFGTDVNFRTLTVRPLTNSTTNPFPGEGFVLLREMLQAQTGYSRIIPAGFWTFRMVLRASSVQTVPETTLSARVYKVASNNARTLLFIANDTAYTAGVGYAERVWGSTQSQIILGIDETIEIVWMINSKGVAGVSQTFHFPMDQESLSSGGNGYTSFELPSGIRTQVFVSSTLSGSSSMSTVANKTFAASSQLVVAGTLSIETFLKKYSSLTLNASGLFQTTALMIGFSGVALSANGSVVANSTGVAQAVVNVNSSSTISAGATSQTYIIINIVGSTNISTTANKNLVASSQLTASGTVLVETFAKKYATTTLSGAGLVQANALPTGFSSAALFSISTVVVNSERVAQATVDVGGAGTISIGAINKTYTATNIVGLTNVATNSLAEHFSYTSLVGAANVGAVAQLTAYAELFIFGGSSVLVEGFTQSDLVVINMIGNGFVSSDSTIKKLANISIFANSDIMVETYSTCLIIANLIGETLMAAWATRWLFTNLILNVNVVLHVHSMIPKPKNFHSENKTMISVNETLAIEANSGVKSVTMLSYGTTVETNKSTAPRGRNE